MYDAVVSAAQQAHWSASEWAAILYSTRLSFEKSIKCRVIARHIASYLNRSINAQATDWQRMQSWPVGLIRISIDISRRVYYITCAPAVLRAGTVLAVSVCLSVSPHKISKTTDQKLM